MTARQHQLIFLLLVLGVVFVLAHLFALKSSLYWYVWWSDIVMHLFGGILIGLSVHVFAGFSQSPIKATTGWFWLVALAITIGWEVFERSTGLYNPKGYFFDTILDVIMGLTGGLLAFKFFTKR